MRREPWKSSTWKRISYVVWTCCWWLPVLVVQMAAYNGLINAWVAIGLYFGFLILVAYAYGACKDQAERAAVAEHRIKWAREHGCGPAVMRDAHRAQGLEKGCGGSGEARRRRLDDGWPDVTR